MKQRLLVFIILFVLLFSVNSTLFSAELTYDMATGKISGFDLTNADSPETTSSYTGAPEVWTKPGYVGRLNYRGEPTVLTFSNTGDTATGTSNNRFYFTYNTSSTIKLAQWREFFLVTRVKGLYHNGGQHDFVGTNTVIGTNGGTVSITQGAGPEQVASGLSGYNSSGIAGTNNANNDFMYKYKYKFIWVDVTVILTSANKTLNSGYYITQIGISGTTGADYTMILIGERNPSNQQVAASAFYFGIESIVSNPFPYADLFSKNTLGDSLLVGKLRYFSVEKSANVRFASNSGGTLSTYTLQATGLNPVTYNLVFDPTIPNAAASQITSSNTKFNSTYQATISPIDNSSTSGNILEGEIRIFVPINTHPMSGTYTSIIYCILTQV